MKPHYSIPIAECGEPLVPIPLEQFAWVSPHPYMALGATYGDRSPFFVRQTVLKRLRKAQYYLQKQRSGWRLQIFDVYRPLSVQQFMVDYTFQAVAAKAGLETTIMTEAKRQEVLEQVYEFWAAPLVDPATPPPHSTGAAIDLTLVNEIGKPVEMGSVIDELSSRSYPNYFANNVGMDDQRYHSHRELLCQSMEAAGFLRHPKEWWHFSYGDQLWAWLYRQANSDGLAEPAIAHYGQVEETARSI
ncbi:D-alanyl-D-alanine dipeptidase [Phormidium sp. CLA17]|uniref:M15 family metallopeptidase n=1 Tax=Leptolyngbya sp. Cla-17 TaxID=2803751 RepID=UPI00149152F6|nr:M15 family metallopeptidase [Leptolyngbya sp. Cla-17]MBM0741763.1 D-alanyl-D-alanine dipeptidase [Leptolyngbya sp. Cla-17]